MAVVQVSPERPDPSVMSRAATLLHRGQIVAFPTETVYGLGADALDPEAVERIYEAKGRPTYNPLIVHVPDAAAAQSLITSWPSAADALASRWWPGPLTLVLPKAATVPSTATAGLATVALRAPAHPVAQALLRAAGLPLAAPSANRSGEVSPTTAAHVAQSLGDRVPLILDAGPTSVGIESTVVDLSGARPILLRPGMISREMLEEVIGPVDVAQAAGLAESARPSPGMLDRHYAPRARVVLFDRPDEPAVQDAMRASPSTTGVLHWRKLSVAAVLAEQLPDDPAGYARSLYEALRRMDDRGASVILVERPPAGSAWEALHDRLMRAARP